MKPLVLAVALLLAASPTLAQRPQSLTQRWTGSWFGIGQPNDRSQMYIDTFGADGSFRDQHRWCRQGKATDIVESGRWRIAAAILTIDIATVNGKPEPRSDRYRIKLVDDKMQNYVYMPTNFEYRARKVNGSFQMPSCDLSS